MKKTLSLLLAALLALSLLTPVLAAPAGEAEQAAWTLYHFGLFQGTGTDERDFPIFDLDRIPTGPRAWPCSSACWGWRIPP